jgi:dipeptidyl-peptidase-4
MFKHVSFRAGVCRACLVSTLAAASLAARAQRVYTANDYRQAERWMSYNVRPLVTHTVSHVALLPDGRIFYRESQAEGVTYMLADPAHGTKAPAFDRDAVAKAIATASRQPLTGARLNVTSYKVEPGGFSIVTDQGTFHCVAVATRCTPEPAPPAPFVRAGKTERTPAAQPTAAPVTNPPARRRRGASGQGNASPDGALTAFIRDHNLWVRTVATGEERPLTTDGIEDFGYATDNAGWQHSDAAIVTWSADSKKIATFQQDQRKTGTMYLVPVTNSHPKLEAWKYPLLGDKDVTMIEPVVIDVASATVTRLKIEPLEHRSMECDDVSCDGDGRWSDVSFSPDDTRLAFVATSRDHKDEWLKVADIATGDVRDAYHEHVDSYYGWQAKTDWKVLWDTNEFLWASERTNWAQYYLYDLGTGKMKREVTHGDGPVWDILALDAKTRELYFTATGKTPGINPYFRKLYKVNLDGSGQTLLTPEDLDHEITAAPDGSEFVDVYSTLEQPQTTVVRDASGKATMELAKQDISALTSAGWKPPLAITVKGRDGKTDLYGYAWRPTNFDASKKYPLVNVVYPGPQDGSCSTRGGRSFAPAEGDNQSLAELGFIVICVDGMGNPHRSKSFHDAHASKPEDMGDDTIPDQVAATRDLAKKYAWIDLDRVGIWGHSGGGNATASAMFHFPDFFKVGWAESGNHDNRDYEDDWDERWAGLESFSADGTSNYEASANQNYAANLKGHLMLVHGSMDDNVPPNNTLLVAEALMRANKNFDMLIVPNVPHGYMAMTPYIMRRRWDYFVQYLAGGIPPADFTPKPYGEIIRAMYGPNAAIAQDDDVPDGH